MPKMKTHRGAAKRFKVTGTGKLMRRKAFRNHILNRGTDDEEIKARLKMRKEQAGLAHRDDIKVFVDFIDADEKRL